MNLIEQLGGYEKAKRELELKEQNSVLQCCASVTAEMIRDALLEYRRQHNIYEVGDFIVSCGSCAEWSDDVLTIKDVHSNTVVTENFDFVFTFGSYRHATNAEIAAGRRL